MVIGGAKTRRRVAKNCQLIRPLSDTGAFGGEAAAPLNAVENPLYIVQQTKAKIRPCAALGCGDYYYGSCCLEKCNRYQPLA